ncbi:DUF3168 domain-containing protein [Jiella endophytica]|uniref:DUF3168 domain-containing protein n=1 Tax=Jiella endophytica TaxID=2558362 RepID=A0A4Y8RT89_9HYPH|nr:DUF3168 domain-containing protein [Jiella endophytica]TFF27515.1 DUF3168 domain-containing protein [Jiella endophytica]
MSAALAVQKAIRGRLAVSASVTDLVPAASILDRNSRPAPDPSIILGEDQEVDEERIARNVVRVYSTLHVWKKEAGLVGVKAIAGAIRASVQSARFASIEGFHFGDCRVSSTRFMRDPDGETAHGVVTIETLVSEVSP